MTRKAADVPDFDSIHAQYRPQILHYLEGMVGAAEAEELTQETFLRVARGLQDFRGDAKLSTWIYRIATNAALDRLRSRGFREQQRSLSAAADAGTAELADQDPWTGEKPPTTTKALIRKEMDSCVRDVVEQLPQAYRDVLVLSEFEWLKDREIAERLGDSLGAVKIRLHRGRARLKAALEARCTFYRDEGDVFRCEPKPVQLNDLRSKT